MVQLPRPGLENNQGINVKNRNRTPLPNRNNNIPVRITRNHKSSEIPTVTNFRGVTRALIGGVYIHIFVFCPTDFF